MNGAGEGRGCAFRPPAGFKASTPYVLRNGGDGTRRTR